MNREDLKPGMEVIWLYTQPSGWNWTHRIPVKIIKLTAKRVQIEVPKRDGSTVIRWATAEKLIPKE